MKLASSKSALKHGDYSTDRSKAVVPVLDLPFVALFFILHLVLSCFVLVFFLFFWRCVFLACGMES